MDNLYIFRYLSGCRVLVCRNCGKQLGDQQMIFSMSREGPQGMDRIRKDMSFHYMSSDWMKLENSNQLA